jgi:glycosyltransferase involved in cell wall biosynthesis
MRATFVYPSPRRAYAAEVARGAAPDSQLLGQNHLHRHGIDARIHDSRIPTALSPAPLARGAWLLRELLLPVELGATDVVFTGLATLFPVGARLRRFRTVLVNYGLNQIHRRGGIVRGGLLHHSLSAADLVVCFGQSQRDELATQGVASPDRLATIPLGVDDRWFSPRAEPAGRPLVLAVGKDLARDFATFAEAVAQSDVEAQIVALPRNVEGVLIPANARVRQVSLTELRDLYARAACVVIPQYGDSFVYGADGGLTVLLEAMAMGRPVVATDRELIREYVNHDVDALLVPPEDPAALRDAIHSVLADRALSERLGAAARARVEREHSTRGFATQLARLLESVVYPR